MVQSIRFCEGECVSDPAKALSHSRGHLPPYPPHHPIIIPNDSPRCQGITSCVSKIHGKAFAIAIVIPTRLGTTIANARTMPWCSVSSTKLIAGTGFVIARSMPQSWSYAWHGVCKRVSVLINNDSHLFTHHLI